MPNIEINPTQDIASILYTKTVTLTDAQIKTLPTSFVTIVPGQPGKVISFVSGSIYLNATVQDYTNVDATACFFIQYGDFENDCSSLVPFDGNSLFANVTPLTKVTSNGDYPNFSESKSLVAGNIENEDLKICASNLSNFTLGDSANTMKVSVNYLIIDL